jgi:hypothetical protein
VRWDLNNAMVWDTEFGPIGHFTTDFPAELPSPQWVVNGEIRDEAGNTALGQASMVLPSWMPAVPDIIAGEILIAPSGSGRVPTNTNLRIISDYQDWMNKTGLEVIYRYYLNDEYLGEKTFDVGFCNTDWFCWRMFTIEDGIQEPGPFTIRVEAELLEGIE